MAMYWNFVFVEKARLPLNPTAGLTIVQNMIILSMHIYSKDSLGRCAYELPANKDTINC